MRIPGARRIGLQAWLGAAMVAVGLIACLTMLGVLLPTLESSVRNDRSVRVANRTGSLLNTAAPSFAEQLDDRTAAQRLLTDLAIQVRGEVALRPRSPFAQPQFVGDPDRFAGERLALVGQSQLGGVSQARFLPDQEGRRWVITAVPVTDGPEVVATLDAAVEATDSGSPIAIVRRRLAIGVIMVLVLASLLGYALARLFGRRTVRLVRTASDLAAGDLSARAPSVGPAELTVLGDSLNRMAGRLQNLVGEITHDRDRAEGLIASLAEGVVAARPDGEVTVANAAARRLLELPGGGEPVPPGAMPPEIIDGVREVTAEEGPKVVTREVSVAGRELEVQVVGLSDAAAGVVVTLRDVTEERRLDRARRDLVANVSHELKTPLSAIKGFQELLEDEQLSGETRTRFLDLMSKEITRMERLVEDQLQLARLDSGAFPLEREPVDLAELAAGVAEPRQVLATREGVTLSVYAPPGEPVVAEVDPARVEQILLILLDNALRHTPSGGRIRVAVERRGGDHVAISVADDGEGIPSDAQPFVFDRFYRGDASRAGRSAGLGLAIARGLAKAHGGEIDLRSMPEVGSAFTVLLPATDPSAANAVEEPVEPLVEHPVPSE